MRANFTIQEILSDHWGSFLPSHPNIRSVVIHEVAKVMDCGNPNNGCAFYACPDCGAYKFVPFRCHSRFCNTCGTAYQEDRAATIFRKLINCRHRHIVFTIAEELRIYFLKDRDLLPVLFRSAAQVIQDWLYDQNHSEQFSAGMVVAMHTFGRDLKWNPHIHMLITEGASGKFTKWKKINHFPYIMLRKKWRAILLANLKTAIDPKKIDLQTLNGLVSKLYRLYPEGFYVHAPYKENFHSPMAVAKYITRYIGRPVMAQSRITGYDGEHVTYWYQRHEDNEIVPVTEHAHTFIEKLILHIPEKRFNMLRYYGLYAMPDKRTSKLFHLVRNRSHSAQRFSRLWAVRIERAFHRDPLKCPCGGYMEFKNIYVPHSQTHPPPPMLQFAYL